MLPKPLLPVVRVRPLGDSHPRAPLRARALPCIPFRDAFPFVSCVHRAGRTAANFPSGAKFDSSYDRGSPTTFAPNQVIKGWTEAMQLMVEGDKWEL